MNSMDNADVVECLYTGIQIVTQLFSELSSVQVSFMQPLHHYRDSHEILFWKSPDYANYHGIYTTRVQLNPLYCAHTYLSISTSMTYKYQYRTVLASDRQCLEHLSHNVTHTHAALLKRPFTPPLLDPPLFWWGANCFIILTSLLSIIAISCSIIDFSNNMFV